MGFADQVRQFSDETKDNLDNVARKAALGAFREVVERTPVDTGRAKGNWFAQVNGYSSATDETAGANDSGYLQVISGFAMGDFITLTNNLPYAMRLEYGWSDQAPGGMVRLTAQRWQPIVDAAVAEVLNGG